MENWKVKNKLAYYFTVSSANIEIRYRDSYI